MSNTVASAKRSFLSVAHFPHGSEICEHLLGMPAASPDVCATETMFADAVHKELQERLGGEELHRILRVVSWYVESLCDDSSLSVTDLVTFYLAVRAGEVSK